MLKGALFRRLSVPPLATASARLRHVSRSRSIERTITTLRYSSDRRCFSLVSQLRNRTRSYSRCPRTAVTGSTRICSFTPLLWSCCTDPTLDIWPSPRTPWFSRTCTWVLRSSVASGKDWPIPKKHLRWVRWSPYSINTLHSTRQALRSMASAQRPHVHYNSGFDYYVSVNLSALLSLGTAWYKMYRLFIKILVTWHPHQYSDENMHWRRNFYSFTEMFKWNKYILFNTLCCVYKIDQILNWVPFNKIVLSFFKCS